MNERDATVVREFKRRIPTDLKASVARLIAYGSRARGDAAEDSDLDVLALVTPLELFAEEADDVPS